MRSTSPARICRYRRWLLPALSLLALVGCSASWKAPMENRGSQPRHASTETRSQPSIRTQSYRVRRGDTLYAIAWRSGRDFRSLARWNRIPPPYTIYPGQVLTLKPQARPTKPSSRSASAGRTTASTRSAPAPSSRPQAITKPEPKSSRPVQARGPLRWEWPAGGPVLVRYSASDPTRKGIKIGGSQGQAVRAAEGGQVVYSGSGLIGYGQLIIIKHNDNYLSAYGHNAKLLVKEGEQVARGRHIANMGRSNDGKPMLHFEIRRDGRPVDPLALLPRK